jgi:hypothetical protein
MTEPTAPGGRCPVLEECLEQGEELKWILSRLRKSRRVCRYCIDAGECELHTLLRQTLGQAAREALEDLRRTDGNGDGCDG